MLPRGGEITVGTVCPGNVLLTLKHPGGAEAGEAGEDCEGDILTALGVRGLGSCGLTSCLAGGLMVGIKTSVKTLLSRL